MLQAAVPVGICGMINRVIVLGGLLLSACIGSRSKA